MTLISVGFNIIIEGCRIPFKGFPVVGVSGAEVFPVGKEMAGDGQLTSLHAHDNHLSHFVSYVRVEVGVVGKLVLLSGEGAHRRVDQCPFAVFVAQ